MVRVSNMLNDPNLWRFLGPLSSIAGLVTYARSSTFQRVYGQWNFYTGFAYIMVSFIVFGVISFANKLRISSHFLLKAHLEFLVLMLTSLHSYYYDRANIEKSDALTLISCAAFSLMLLSLSRQINRGFVGDLLSFFLGCFALQLMKIEKIHFILVAVAFCYSLILLRSYADSLQLQSKAIQVKEQVDELKNLAENGELDEVDNGRSEELYRILQMEKMEKDTIICEASITPPSE